MKKLGVGLFLPNDPSHLELYADLIDGEADYFELSPESFWVGSSAGAGIEFHESVKIFEAIRDLVQKPFVGHGLAFSPGTPVEGGIEKKRTSDWLDILKRTQEKFNFRWYSEHLGFSNSASGVHAVLPLPLPQNEESTRTVSERMALLKNIFPEVAFENSVFYMSLDDPALEGEFYNDLCTASGSKLMLDLHNVYTHCFNFNVDPEFFISTINLENVIQIHLSGGSLSAPAWFKSEKTMRLDSHDSLIPPEVMKLYESVLPKCKNLRGVIVERLNKTLPPEKIDQFTEQFRKVKILFNDLGTSAVE